MHSTKDLTVLLVGVCCLASTRAARCLGNIYDLYIHSNTGQAFQCTGQLLGWAVEDGPGSSPCFAPANATCAMVAEQINGAQCYINLYHGIGACDKNFRVGILNCNTAGAVYGGVFDRFDIECI
ncbi:hypothetical protein DL768_001991 [Monosporascus sp. mg162]|nr:hypothetical protein DL768_001991 [Monosporascus sp. mg162]